MTAPREIRSLVLAAIAVVGLASCGTDDREVEPVPSSRSVRDLCDHVVAYARQELGAVEVRDIGTEASSPVEERATCDLRGPSNYGEAGALTLSLTLTGKSAPPLAPGGDYRAVPGVTPLVLVNRANTAPLFSTEIDGWSGVLTVDPDGLRTPSGVVDVGPGTDRRYAEFLLTLVRDYGQWE